MCIPCVSTRLQVPEEQKKKLTIQKLWRGEVGEEQISDGVLVTVRSEVGREVFGHKVYLRISSIWFKVEELWFKVGVGFSLTSYNIPHLPRYEGPVHIAVCRQCVVKWIQFGSARDILSIKGDIKGSVFLTFRKNNYFHYIWNFRTVLLKLSCAYVSSGDL